MNKRILDVLKNPVILKTLIVVVLGITVVLISKPAKNSTNSTTSNTIKTTEQSVNKEEKQYYQVTNVVDGDTLDVLIDGKTERIRLIGINTPETVDPRRPVECFGVEASKQAKKLLLGQLVYVEADPTQGDKDKYNRLLRYVFLTDTTNIALKMISDGYGHEYTYDLPYKYQQQFKEAERNASSNNLGLWNTNACAEISPTPTPTPTPLPTTTPIVIVTPAPTRTTTTTQGTYSCNCSKTCPNMGCAEAQYQLNVCGCNARDGDHDGTACDAQCQ